MKLCTGCNRTLGVEAFAVRRLSKDGLNYRCRDCIKTYRIAAYPRQRAKIIECSNRWRENNRERYRQWHAEYNQRNKAKHADYHRKKLYGLAPGEYDKMLEDQDHRCACCGTEKPGGRANAFMVDHDHATGRVRGLLCTSCNLAIGKLGDDLISVLRAVDYLYRAERLDNEAFMAERTVRP